MIKAMNIDNETQEMFEGSLRANNLSDNSDISILSRQLPCINANYSVKLNLTDEDGYF